MRNFKGETKKMTDANNNHVKFNLLDNALDSFFEGYHQFELASTEQSGRRWKFVIFHIAHFLELFLKYAIYSKHPLLVYKQHYRPCTQYSRTISLVESIEVLSNLEMSLPEDFRPKAEWLNKLRNNAMHFEFQYDPQHVKDMISQVVKLAVKFDENNQVCEILNLIQNKDTQIYSDILVMIDEYDRKLSEAESLIQNEYNKQIQTLKTDEMGDFMSNWEVLECEECGNSTFIQNDDSPTGYQCTFCKNQHSSELVQHECLRCSESTESRRMRNGLCDYCAHMLEKD